MTVAFQITYGGKRANRDKEGGMTRPPTEAACEQSHMAVDSS
jgi:hypothetical protein